MTGWENEQEELTIDVGERTPKIIQLTDPHIFKEEKGCLLGLNTRKSLRAVLEDIVDKEINPDLIIATGDISQDQSPESYEYFSRSHG